MKHSRLGVGIIFVAGLAACSFLLPEGMVIRGPILRSLLGSGIDAPADSVVESRFKVPDGYRVELFAEGVSQARVLRFSPNGSLLVSQPREGQILHVLADQDGDGLSGSDVEAYLDRHVKNLSSVAMDAPQRPLVLVQDPGASLYPGGRSPE